MFALRHELLKRSVLFAAPILLSTAVGVFSIPVLVATLGAGTWSSLVVLQSIGQFFAIFVAFGWGATGPSMVAAEPQENRRQFYLDSLVARGLILVLAVPAATVVGALVTGRGPAEAFLSGLAYSLPGVGAAWFFIGTNRPMALLVFDSLPLILGQIAGLIAVLLSPTLLTYLAAMALFSTLGIVASASFVLTRSGDGPAQWGRRTRLRTLYGTQLGGTATMVSASVYSTLPVTLVQLVAPAVLPVYAIADRLYKYAVLALGPILQAVQGWVPEGDASQTIFRARRTMQLGGAVGAVGGLFIFALAPWASDFLTLGQAPLSFGVAAILGFAFFAESIAQVSGLAGLVVLGGVRHLAWSSIAAAVVGLPLFALLTAWLGVLGAAIALAIVAAGTAVYRATHVVRLARRAQDVSQGSTD